jgi:sulfite reductase (NADPH) flavoprotein alpha-component
MSAEASVTQVPSVCPYCGVGCGIVMEVANQRVIKISGDKRHPANRGRLCTKGSTCAQALRESGRMESAFLRPTRGQEPARVGIDVALRETARRLREVLDTHGPDAIAFYVSGQMSLEAQYLANKLAKGFIRTQHIESNSRLCMASAGSGYKLSLGSDGPPGAYDDFEHADLFFVSGANMADCHPILFLRMMDRVKKAGAKLIVVDPRRTATADKADLFLQLRPGTDLALLNGLLHLILKNGRTDPAFIEQHTRGWEAMPAFLDDYPPGRVAEITGLPEADIRRAAEWIGEANEWMSCWTMGLNQSTHGTWHTNAVCNLHLATGAICRPGSGPFSLTGQPNAMGGREMGYMGPGLPGQRSSLVEADRAHAEACWGLPPGTLRTDAGHGTVALFEDMKAGRIKACWVICTNPVASVANRQNVIEGLQAAELVITQDAFLDTETNRYADILLPGALWAEAEGVMVNSERNLTLMRQAVAPVGDALPDWQIIARVACAMGFADAFGHTGADEVFEEIKQFWNPRTGYDLRGASHARLRESPLQWPCAPGGPQRNPLRYLNDGVSQAVRHAPDGSQPPIAFATEDGRAVFLPRPHALPAEMPNSEYPFVLNTGRLQHQWHTLTKTGKIPTLNKLNPGPFVELHPEDAAALGVRDKDTVEIRSRRGRAVLPVVVTDRVRPGNCFAPFHWNDVFGEHLAINAVTSDATDPLSLQPAFKFCAVALTRVTAPAAPSPTPPLPAQEHDPMPIPALARLLGLETAPALALEAHEQHYLQGFLVGLGSEEGRQRDGVPTLPPTAPLAPARRLWVDGVLAGLFSRARLPGSSGSTDDAPLPSPAPAKAEADTLLVLWASQTGRAEGVAAECAQALQRAGRTARIAAMDSVAPADLARAGTVLCLASTFGDGDPPDNATALWQALQASDAPALGALRFGVLAFGDSSYDQFCGFGRRLDARLQALGAQRLLPRVDCEPDAEDAARQWLSAAVQALAPVPASALVNTVFTTTAPDTAPPLASRQHPVQARLTLNRRLNAPRAEKETRQHAIGLQDSGLRYEAGDALGVWPTHCPGLVDELLAALRLTPDAAVQLPGQGEMPLSQALRQHREIARITPELLRFAHERSGSASLGELLHPDRQAALRQWMWGRQPLDLFRAFPFTCDAASLLAALKPMQPRLYSIASSPKVHADEAHLTVSTVRYACEGQARKGVCSTFLAYRAEDQPVPVFVQRSAHFRPPRDPRTPMVMVGPGTGVAPFRAFLQDRRADGATGRHWLFFGEQRAATDFYYRDELEALQREGFLHRLDTAFSRDQAEKVYVQHRMAEQGAALWSWLEEGAHFYVCGDASRMAKDVDAALKAVVQRHGGMSSEAAAAYVGRMAQDKRYVRDVY